MPVKPVLPKSSLLPDWLQPSGTPDAGTFDVSGGVESAAKEGASLLGPLISIYKDKAAREAATEEFKASIRTLASKIQNAPASINLSRAGDWLAENYPRVAAHMRADPDIVEKAPFEAAMGWSPLVQGSPSPGEFILGDRAIKRLTTEPDYAKGIVAHEATHAAQALGNKQAPNLYNINQAIGEYRNNPFEETAFRRQYTVESGLDRPNQLPPFHHEFGNQLASKLKNIGISLDQQGSSFDGPMTLKLRKWGMPATPENYIDPTSLPPELYSQFRQYQVGPRQYMKDTGYYKPEGGYTEYGRQMLDAKAISPVPAHIKTAERLSNPQNLRKLPLNLLSPDIVDRLIKIKQQP